MSATAPDGEEPPDRVELLRFRVADEPYALEVGRVGSIAKVPDLTRVPRAPPTVAGVARPRDETVVVIDAHELLGFDGTPPDGDDPRHRLLLVDRGEPGTAAGFVVDRVERTLTVEVDRLATPDAPAADPSIADPDLHLVLAATDDGQLPVLDVPRVVAAATAVDGLDGRE